MRTRDCFHPRRQSWRLPCWAEGWRCQSCPGCCRGVSRGGPSPPAAAPSAPAAAPAAAASGAAGAARPRAPRSWFARLPHAARLTAETTTLRGTRQKQAVAVSRFYTSRDFRKATLKTPVRGYDDSKSPTWCFMRSTVLTVLFCKYEKRKDENIKSNFMNTKFKQTDDSYCF